MQTEPTEAEMDAIADAEERQAKIDSRAARYAGRGIVLPITRLRALEVGESWLFTQYHSASQVGNPMQRLSLLDGLHFAARRERDPATGAVLGVRVLRVK